ncbi:MAG TPA: metal transporter [Thermoanaerobaculia bacterium]|jgi:zinc transporter ZupT|nr:metal transporter [Thermoanaerobaculia bacterium]
MAADAIRRLLLGVLPLLALAALLVWIVRSRPAESLRGDAPPVEILSIQKVELAPREIVVSVLNDGPDRSTIAQVQVDDAYWSFTQDPPGPLTHLSRARLRIPYPWVHGETHVVRLVTATGLTFDHEIAVAVATPRPGWRFLGLFALIGLYVGIIPVALGLLWYPLLHRLSRRALDFVLALTLGLLLFLLVDALHEGLEAAGELPGSFQGVALLAFGAAAAYLALEALGRWLRSRRAQSDAAWVTALLLAIGIGLHNFGEGLAVGAAFALGEAALGTLLILGFTLHNLTEGLAIVAPLAKSRVPLRRLLLLGLIGGAPTIAGAWLGGFTYSPVWAVLFLAVGAGAIAQVIVQIFRGVAGERPLASYLGSGPAVAGLFAGFTVMYATGLLLQ